MQLVSEKQSEIARSLKNFFPLQGEQLFEQVCRAFGLREEWYFGLQYEDTKGNICWLKKEKKVIDQNINKDAEHKSKYCIIQKGT